MPYRKQDIEISENCKRIELSYLIKNNLIRENSSMVFELNWNVRGEEKGNISAIVYMSESEKYINLLYNIKNNYSGESKNYDYRINLIPVKSNLGFGKVYYFECPETLRLCRVLYMAYGSETFKSRFAYRNRIYYELQVVSKLYSVMERTRRIEVKIQRLDNSRMKTTYRGRETITYKRYKALEQKLQRYEYFKNIVMLNTIEKLKRITGR